MTTDPTAAVAVLSDAEAALLVQRAGGTPVYAYSRATLAAQLNRVRAASPVGCGVYYSLKANPHPGVVNALAGAVDGFDVCSVAEMETALDAGMTAERVLFTGPAKSRTEAAAALAAGVAVTVESLGQARLLTATAAELGVAGRAVIRLNTPYPHPSSGGAPAPNHFGVGDEEVAATIASLSDSLLRPVGLHLFYGSQYADASVLRTARRAALERATAVQEELGLRLEFVSIGGGIALPWCSSDPEVDWEGLFAGAADPIPQALAAAEVVCEYGRALVGPAGSLITAVLDTKAVGDRRYVLVDAGLNHAMLVSRLIAGAGRGEPSVRAVAPKHPDRLTPATVTGPLCSQLDVLAKDVLLPEVQAGDLLVFGNLGAYGPTFSPSGFLSRDPVREVVHG